MSRRPMYKQGDKVCVNRGAGVYLEGQVMSYKGGPWYEVAVAGQGRQEVQERSLSPRPRQDYGQGPEEAE
jgi:hypothetical protein